MGITTRTRANGDVVYVVQIRKRREGKLVLNIAETFEREAAAVQFEKKTLAEFDKTGKGPTKNRLFGEVMDSFKAAGAKAEELLPSGRRRLETLEQLRDSDFAKLRVKDMTCASLIKILSEFDVQPSTRMTYLSYISPIMNVAESAFGDPISPTLAAEVRKTALSLRLISPSNRRTRRPTLDELDAIMTVAQDRATYRHDRLPMELLTYMAIFTCRRQNEIVRLVVEDIDWVRSEIISRKMKDPRRPQNDMHTFLLPEAVAVLQRIQPAKGRFFPYRGKSVGVAFATICTNLQIDNLNFHDLRHEGISRLFEMGWTLPQVASVSAHRSWNSLQRYTHLRQTGDKYKDWPWHEKILALCTGPLKLPRPKPSRDKYWRITPERPPL